MMYHRPRTTPPSPTRLARFILAFALLVFVSIPLTGQAQNDQKLRIATKPLEPFVIVEGEVPRGFSIDLWSEVARRLDLDYEWVMYDTVSEILQAVIDGEADVAIAGISMTSERELQVDFTHPFYDAGLQIMVPASQPSFIQGVIRQFTSPGLVAFFVIGLVAAFVMTNIVYFTERRHDPDFQNGYLRGLWEGLWWMMSMVVSGEHPESGTHKTYRRLMTIAFWLIGLFLIVQFEANVTADTTINKLAGDIGGPEDLPGKRVVTVEGSTAAEYLADKNIRYIGVSDIEEAYPLLENNRADAIVYDAPVLQYYAITGGNGRVSVVGSLFKPEKYGIALSKGSELRKPVNEVLLEMYQDGTLAEIEDRWFRRGEP